ncbi:MAG TPA: cellulase family glycosylhydrolase [Anaerolineales bacterium]|nr:cellulase family glycosylhydrolase [Anaerolineales bacterium]
MPNARWTAEKANEWYEGLPWLVGCNFIPSTAINQLEMWQPETFDPETISRELKWAAGIGFNVVRVYLHNLLWESDQVGFEERIKRFLDIAASHQIRTVFVLFDDCWNTNPQLGKQPEPKPGIHNSGWVQSPGSKLVTDESSWDTLADYVRGVIRTFAQDERILMWDLYNEPGNNGLDEKSLPLLQSAVTWAREANPSQPITIGLWYENESLNDFQLYASDVITFHNYLPEDDLLKQITTLKEHGRPLICTEYMARTRGSLFEKSLPIFKRENVGCINWGLVNGKTQTIYPWGSPGGEAEPELWFHDIFHRDGKPYRQEEVDFIKEITG